MKQFLLDQYNQFSFDKVKEFAANLTKDRHSDNQLLEMDDCYRIWGWLGNDFWFMRTPFIFGYENEKVYHFVGPRQDGYVENYRRLQAALSEESFKFSTIVETDMVIQTAVNHPNGLPAGSQLNYIRFEIPTPGYGLDLKHITHVDANSKYACRSAEEAIVVLSNFIDIMTKITAKIKELDMQCLSIAMEVDDVFLNNGVYYIRFLPNFGSTIEEFLQETFRDLVYWLRSLVFFRFISAAQAETVVNYARSKWIPLQN
jgi:hypothetical protein